LIEIDLVCALSHKEDDKMKTASLLVALLPLTQAVRIVVSNDDGWAEINVRTLFNTLVAAGQQVILSAPAEGKSGTGMQSRFQLLLYFTAT